MTMTDESLPRERILQAALRLLEAGGAEAVSTRAVSGAAGVQVPTLYRQFGDMQGLLSAVASQGFDVYLRQKAGQEASGDPVADLRVGWDRHVQFGLDHPHLYRLMYSVQGSGPVSGAVQQAGNLLRALLVRVAETGRLAVSVERAAELIHAAGTGVTISLIGEAGQPGQPGLAALMRGAVFGAILTPEPQAEQIRAGASARQRAAPHAAALDALLPGLDAEFTAPERALLSEWLHRLG